MREFSILERKNKNKGDRQIM